MRIPIDDIVESVGVSDDVGNDNTVLFSTAAHFQYIVIFVPLKRSP